MTWIDRAEPTTTTGRATTTRPPGARRVLIVLAALALLATALAPTADAAPTRTRTAPPTQRVTQTSEIGLRSPTALAYDADRALLLVGETGGRVVEVDLEGQRVRTVPRGQLRSADFGYDRTTGTVTTLDDDGVTTATVSLAGAEDTDAVIGAVLAPTADSTDAAGARSVYVLTEGQLTELALEPTVLAATTAPVVTAPLVRTVDLWRLDPPSPDSAGVTYLDDVGHLLVSDSEVNEMPLFRGANLFELSLSASDPAGGPFALVATGDTTPWSQEPTGVGYDRVSGHLFSSNDDTDRVYRVDGGADGRFGTSDDTVTNFGTKRFGSTDTEDVTVDTTRGNVLVVDGVDKEVWRVDPGPNGVYENPGDDVVTRFDVEQHGALDPEGIAYNRFDDTLLVLDQKSRSVYELSPAGALLRTIRITTVTTRLAAGVTLAPASDGSGAWHLYVVERGVDNDTDPTENDGRLHEFGLPFGPTQDVPPDARDDTATTTQDRAVTVDVLANDVPGTSPLEATSLQVVRTPSSGSAVVSGTGRITYTPAAGFVGADAFDYRVCDARGSCDTATVTVSVSGAATTTTVQRRVASSADDAEENATGGVSLTSSDLELVVDKDTQTVGMRFTGVDVPAGATITAASVQFTVDQVSSGASALTVQGQLAPDPGAFVKATRNITSRARTTASVPWSPPAWSPVGAAGAAQRTPDLAGVVQELVGQPGWRSGQSMVLIVTGSGSRVARSFDGAPAAAPLLEITYSTIPPPPPTPSPPAAVDDTATVRAGQSVVVDVLANDTDADGDLVPSSLSITSDPARGTATARTDGTVLYAAAAGAAGQDSFGYRVCDAGARCAAASVTVTVTSDDPTPVQVQARVSSSSDDAEENTATRVSLTSSDLELTLDADEQVVGVRFTGLDVPRGARITDARIQFTTDETGSAATTLRIQGQRAANPGTFTTTRGDVSTRARTTATATWSPPAWTVKGQAGPAQRTDDLSAVVQELVDQAGWSPGNAMVFVVTGSGKRTAASFNGTAAAAPLLQISYLPPG